MARRSHVLALWLFAIAGAAYALDRATKAWAEATLAERAPIDLIPGVLSLTYTTNSGGAFGLGRSAPWIFAGATILVSLAIVVASTRLPRMGVAVALGLILGGALGNLTDRAINGPGLSGHVTDFIDLQFWPIFNLADSAIVIGAGVLAIVTAKRDPPASSPPEGRVGAQGTRR
ncbi:MAG TPA: signal peptidase II [Actinomycetota bacterium]|nr:signal peptidase II [Actinomycetota bacterium]